MAQAASLLVPATLFAIMFALGLGLPAETIQLVRSRRALMLRVLLGSCFLLPLAAVLLLRLPPSIGLSQPARFALALMAVCPSAPLTLRKAGKAGGSPALAATLQVAAALTAIVSIPLMAELITRTYGVPGWDILPRSVARQVAVAQIAPLLAGVALRHWRPVWATRWAGTFDRIANLLLFALIALVLVRTVHVLVPFMGRNLAALGFMAVLVAISLALGYLLAGPGEEERTTVALVTSMRNPGLALLFAKIYAPTMEGLKLAILAYVLVTVVLSVPFVQWRRRAALRAAG